MASKQANSPIYVHGAALALALISSVPIPNGPADTLKSVAWVSYGFVEDTIKGSSILGSLKQQSENHVGTAVFLVYILLAIYMTVRVFGRLAVMSSDIPESQSQKISVFSSMAFLSFVVLAVNMGLFLVESYLAWTKDPVVRLKLLTSSSTSTQQAWKWLSTSTLFVQFAKSLYQTNGAYWWSAQGLLASMLSSTYMTAVGQLYGVEHIAEFILLAQLLPVSFAQNLFFVAVLLQRIKKPASSKTSDTPRLLPEPVGWAALIAFRALIAYLPVLASKAESTLAVILGSRLLILSNYLVSFTSGDIIEAAMPWAMLYKIVFSISPAALSVSSILAQSYTLGTNFAVTTMGTDFAIWYASIAMWGLSEYLG